MNKWDKRFLRMANEVASWSKDRATAVGCVVTIDKNHVASLGFNGFPRGIDDDVLTRHERPAKYLWTEHAERNAIYNAARLGVSLQGGTCYVNLFPCCDCARGLIQSGVARVVCSTQPDYQHPVYGQAWLTSLEMFAEANVVVEFDNGENNE